MNQARAVLVYLAVIPLVNVFFDVVSVVLTRWLLTHSQAAPNIWARLRLWGFDFAGATGLMVGLVVSLGFVLGLINESATIRGRQPFLPLAPIHAAVRSPGDDWPNMGWVYFTVLSTFIPTLIHAALTGAAVVGSARSLGFSYQPEEDAKELERPRAGSEEGVERFSPIAERWMMIRYVGSASVGSVGGLFFCFLVLVPIVIFVVTFVATDLVSLSEMGAMAGSDVWTWWVTGCGLDGALRCAPQ